MEKLVVVSNDGKQVNISGDAMDEFTAAFAGELLTASSPGYDDVRQLWNGMHDKRPALIARCTGNADVIAAVNFARQHKLLTAVRGGGHNVSGSGSTDGGLMIDLSNMKGMRVDAKNKTAHAQGGVTWGDLDRETQVFGLATPGGVVSTTGIAGLTIGGGLGHLRKKYGLTIDNVVSVDIVTANGELLTANSEENSDLYWAVRGGGGNFGIITSFEFKLHPVGPLVRLAAPFYAAEEAPAILPVWRDFIENSPDEISSTAMFWTIPPVEGFPEEHYGKRVLILPAVYSGSVDEGEKIMQPLREISTPLVDLSMTLPWTALQTMFDPFFPKGAQHYYFKSTYLKELDDETIAAMLDKALNPPQPMVLIAIWQYGGAMSRVDDSATPFLGRKNKYLFSIDCCWADPAADGEVLTYARGFWKEMEAYSPGGLYVNFAGLGEEGEELVKSAYGVNYDRLKQIKQKYDPENLFRLNQNIKP